MTLRCLKYVTYDPPTLASIFPFPPQVSPSLPPLPPPPPLSKAKQIDRSTTYPTPRTIPPQIPLVASTRLFRRVALPDAVDDAVLVQAGEEGVAGGPAEGAGVPVWGDEGAVGGGGGGKERHFFFGRGGFGGGEGEKRKGGEEVGMVGWVSG